MEEEGEGEAGGGGRRDECAAVVTAHIFNLIMLCVHVLEKLFTSHISWLKT